MKNINFYSNEMSLIYLILKWGLIVLFFKHFTINKWMNRYKYGYFSKFTISSRLFSAMARSIKLFQSLRQFCETLDISYSPQFNQHRSFNWKILCILIFIIIHTVTSIAFFLFEAKSIQEYGDSFYAILSEFLCLASSPTIISKMPDIFMLIENFEKFIEKSTV